MRNQSLTRSSHVHAHLLPSPTTFRTGIIDLGSHALQCNTVLSCAERTPLKSTCCHALQCNTVLSCITMPARCDGITKQSRFTIPMTMCCHALQCNTVLSCITMPARCDGITKQSRFTIPMTMLLSTSATRFCYAVTAALPIMCCLATAQHAVKRERSTVLRHHQQVRIR